MLLAAFQYFDTEGRGYLTKEKFQQIMMEEGEPFFPVSVSLTKLNQYDALRQCWILKKSYSIISNT